MQYTPHYNLNLPEGTDIVNPLVQDNPNYSAIDTALYDNKLRVIGTATELATGTLHALTRADQDIPVFKFVATSDYNTGDTFTVDGVSVTAKLPDGTLPKDKAYKINSSVIAVLDGTLLTFVGLESSPAFTIESGSNANGTYTKFSDGTMICTKRVPLTGVDVNASWGSLYESTVKALGDFAAPFNDVPMVNITNHGVTGGWIEYCLHTSATYIGDVRLVSPNALTNATYVLHVTAVGTWS